MTTKRNALDMSKIENKKQKFGLHMLDKVGDKEYDDKA